MKLKQIYEKEFPLFKRKEMQFEIVYTSSTPKNDEIKKLVIAELKKPEDVIVVDLIKQSYGRGKALVKVKVYESPEDLKKGEVINKKPKKKEEKK